MRILFNDLRCLKTKNNHLSSSKDGVAECPYANLRTNTFKKGFRINTITQKDTCAVSSSFEKLQYGIAFCKSSWSYNLKFNDVSA